MIMLLNNKKRKNWQWMRQAKYLKKAKQFKIIINSRVCKEDSGPMKN